MNTKIMFEMILKINPKIFNKMVGEIGVEHCKNKQCKTMLEWDIENELWNCPKCNTIYK